MKTRTKKLLVILLLAIVAISIIPISVNADTTAKISLSSSEVSAGGTTTIEMKLEGEFSANQFTEKLKFDNTKLEVVNIEAGEVLDNVRGNPFWTEEAADANSAGEVVAGTASNKDVAVKPGDTGVIIKVTFKVKAGVSGNQPLTLASTVKKNDPSNPKNSLDISNTVETKGGSINVVVPVTGVKLDKTSASLDLNGTVTLNATVEPANATGNKTVTWTSSNTSVATVNNGVVKAVKEGTATITATVAGKTASCTVTVACSHSSKTEHPAKEATCLEKGNTAYTVCNVCGKIVAGENKEIPVKEHTYGNLIPEVAKVHTATELKNGTAAHYECSVCHKLFNKDKQEVKAEDLVIKAEHSYKDFEITEETHSAKCDCGKVLENEAHKGGTAYCTEKAVCEVCGAHYGEVDPDNHKGGEATCVAKAVCELCGEEYGEIDPDNHVNTELKDAVEATTEKEGYSGDVYCKDCEKVVEKGEILPKLEKEPEVKDPNKPNTADSSNIMLWVSLSLVSIIGIVYVVKHNQKRSKNS